MSFRISIVLVLALFVTAQAKAAPIATPPDRSHPIPEPRGPQKPGKDHGGTKGHHAKSGKGHRK